MSDVSEHSDSEFYFPKKKRKKKEKRGGHMIKCLLTELGRAGQENIWPSVMAHGPGCARSVRHDLEPNIFPSGPPTQSISTYDNPLRGILQKYSPRSTPTRITFNALTKQDHQFTSTASHLFYQNCYYIFNTTEQLLKLKT